MLKANFGMSECDSAPQNDSENTDQLKYRGSHSMLDIRKCYIKEKDTETVFLALFNGFKEICGNNNLRIVGEKMVVFDGSVSPPGGTIIIMLDESHISLHSYGEEGILAVDCFTCSKNPENHINAVSDIKKLIAYHFPEGELMKYHSVGRFATL
jgi:S-adenosylmethionine/arginine decarboxylase-like enzyme